jgi:hypothetical protein
MQHKQGLFFYLPGQQYDPLRNCRIHGMPVEVGLVLVASVVLGLGVTVGVVIKPGTPMQYHVDSHKPVQLAPEDGFHSKN